MSDKGPAEPDHKAPDGSRRNNEGDADGTDAS